MDDETRDLHSQTIAILLGFAETTTEINTLTRVGRRAGFLWRCPTCERTQYVNVSTCCGKPRPVGDTPA